MQHAEFGVLVDEETDVEGKGVLHDALVHLYLVRVVGHNIHLAEPLVVDERRCADLGTILDIAMSIDVGDRLPIPGISKKFHRVYNDGFFGVSVSSASSGRYGFSEPLKAGVGFVLDDLVHAIHYETVRKVPYQQRCGEQELIATNATHEHATRRLHDVVFFSIMSHERTYVVSSDGHVLEHGLHLGKVMLQMFRDVYVAFYHT